MVTTICTLMVAREYEYTFKTTCDRNMQEMPWLCGDTMTLWRWVYGCFAKALHYVDNNVLFFCASKSCSQCHCECDAWVWLFWWKAHKTICCSRPRWQCPSWFNDRHSTILFQTHCQTHLKYLRVCCKLEQRVINVRLQGHCKLKCTGVSIAPVCHHNTPLYLIGSYCPLLHYTL